MPYQSITPNSYNLNSGVHQVRRYHQTLTLTTAIFCRP